MKLSRREVVGMGFRIVLGASVFPIGFSLSGCSNDAEAITHGRGLVKDMKEITLDHIKITVIYDNNPHLGGLQTDWGFSCLVEGLGQTILFDTGRYDNLLASNFEKLGADPARADILFLSHEHPDHVGGMTWFLKRNPNVTLFLPKSFTSSTKNEARDLGARVVEVADPVPVNPHCLSSGEMKSFVKNEHALYILTNKGWIVITGCAHPGIGDIVERVTRIADQKVLLAMGGFHLMSDSDGSIREIASRFNDLGVRHVAPTHCSGGLARRIFAEKFGERYLDCGVGRVIKGKDLSS